VWLSLQQFLRSSQLDILVNIFFKECLPNRMEILDNTIEVPFAIHCSAIREIRPS